MTRPDGYPLVLLPTAVAADREPLPQARGGSGIRRPSPEEQGRRLSGKWAALQAAIDDERASVSASLAGNDPQLIIVLEVAGRLEDFSRAVVRIDGFEFLAEMDEDSLLDNTDTFAYEDDDSRVVPGTLYLMASNQQALAGVLDLWTLYQREPNESFPHGQNRWKSVFQLLVDVRRWSAEDRLRGTGAREDFALRVSAGQENLPAELELWYRAEPSDRDRAQTRMRLAVEAAGGSVIKSLQIAEISYHVLLVSLPAQAVAPLLEAPLSDLELLRVEDLAFVRPQTLLQVDSGDEPTANAVAVTSDETHETPRIALIDGVPLANHQALGGALVLDDPDDLASDYQASQRVHGTAMASLILWGDLNSPRQSARPIYARPVLVPEVSLDGRVCERIPQNELALDLIHRAIVRMLDGDGQSKAAAPEVRVVNLSIGDSTQPLLAVMSPWARLLDWLSHKYQLVFVVSAGNCPDSLELPISVDRVNLLAPVDVSSFTFRKLVASAHTRRLLSPSESLNALTVGSTHSDASPPGYRLGARRDLLPAGPTGSDAFASPINTLGMGYRQSIKPDILTDGGRVLFNPRPGNSGAAPSLWRHAVSPVSVPPGILAASPGVGGSNTGQQYIHGTSASAAIISHHMGSVMEYLETLQDAGGTQLESDLHAIVAKAMVVHSSRIPPSSQLLRNILAESVSSRRLRGSLSRFYGYGVLDPDGLTAGNLSKVTCLGAGVLLPEQGHEYAVPLPPSMSGIVTLRRVTITVASLLPTRPRDRRHRASEVYFLPPTDDLLVARVDSDHHGVRRGSVQHEVLEGNQALAFVDGDVMRIKVSCRSLTGSHKDPASYGLAVTIDCPESGLPIHAEVASRVSLAVEVRARVKN